MYVYVHIVYRSGFSAESNLAEVFADVAGDSVRPWGNLSVNKFHPIYRIQWDLMAFIYVYIGI